MKKQILFAATALMLTAGVVAGSNESAAKAPKKIAINKKNFPDQVFRELVKSNYDKNKDKKLWNRCLNDALNSFWISANFSINCFLMPLSR